METGRQVKFENQQYGVRVVVTPAGVKHVDNVVRDYEIIAIEVDTEHSPCGVHYSMHPSVEVATCRAKAIVKGFKRDQG